MRFSIDISLWPAAIYNGSVEISAEQETIFYEEVKRLFYLFRLTQLNIRYYGSRASKFSSLVNRAQVLAAVLSGGAIAFLALPGDLKIYAGILAALSGLVAGALPSFGWSDKAKEMYALHLAHKQLFGQIQELLQEIKRDGLLSERSAGASQVVHDTASRLEMLDELEEDKALKDKLDEGVREAFPPDYVWTSL